jgi:hypothetical protein
VLGARGAVVVNDHGTFELALGLVAAFAPCTSELHGSAAVDRTEYSDSGSHPAQREGACNAKRQKRKRQRGALTFRRPRRLSSELTVEQAPSDARPCCPKWKCRDRRFRKKNFKTASATIFRIEPTSFVHAGATRHTHRSNRGSKAHGAVLTRFSRSPLLVAHYERSHGRGQRRGYGVQVPECIHRL